LEELWALKDINFEVQQGERVGIIGANGAGKSTLLKILSRITEPTTGRVRIKGRVSSLLEVGTGFHPELTGRENIFLNGAILGMSRQETKRKFDEIIAFAELEKFLDTPVKRYSSGMYVRLAFAVAAHLEPEILIVDEVLAVGDAAFQKKCLGKMEGVAKEGRTVLLVSHNMGSIQQLVSRVIVLESGCSVYNGSVVEGISCYMEKLNQESSLRSYRDLESYANRKGSGQARYARVRLFDESGQSCCTFHYGQPFKVQFGIESIENLDQVLVGYSFITANGTEIQGSTLNDFIASFTLKEGITKVECNVNPNILLPGLYNIRAAIIRKSKASLIYDYIENILSFEIMNTSYDQRNSLPYPHCVGLVHVAYKWQVLGNNK
jgi:lipopolysaccharide transport system ATP-binding protein